VDHPESRGRARARNVLAFINGLRRANVDIDRKLLAELAVRDAEAFKQLAVVAKEASEG
jgi:large subunit ribosomal protein L20